MTPSAVRRPALPLLVAALLAAGPAAAASSQETGGPDGGPVHRAVASYAGGVPTVPGVRVLERLPRLGVLVVEGTPTGLTRLAGAPGVRGLRPDTAVTVTGKPSSRPAVRASAGLGGDAGQPGAGAGVRVAVVDTGVSDTAALDRRSGRLVDGVDTSAGADRPGRSQARLVDGFGHGTFLASVIAGGVVGGAAVGVAPGATVVVVRVARPDGQTRLSSLLAGLEWVADPGNDVDVANLSLSVARPGQGYGADPLTDAVEAVRDAGVSVVVSAGNAPDVVGDPGFVPKALTVGAADLTAARPDVAPFSGSDVVASVTKPDVVASGVGVLGVLPRGSVLARDNPQARVAGGLWRGTGTSQATAVTSGVAALVLAERPTASPAEVKAALRTAALGLPQADRDGAGLLQLPTGAAVHGALDPGTAPGEDGTADPTGETPWDANSWSANSWSANSWSANSWSANSWSANSWSAGSWSANSWSAGSWSANSWSAGSWSVDSGPDEERGR